MVVPLLPGATVCRDLIVRRRLGEGGWGEVWLVESEALGTQYALKRSLHSAAGSRDDMLAEIEAWMSPPPIAGIVPCYFWEIGTAGEILVLVQYFSEGTLGDQLRRIDSPSPTARIIDVLVQVADALVALHDRDLVHGDLTPENILVAEDGSIGITDFGLTTSQNQVTHFTSGTVEYSGYEVASGSPLTAWTDIWSLGLITIEMLVGERFWLSGCVALEIASIAPSKLSADRRCDPILISLLDLATRCFSPGLYPTALAISAELRSLYRRHSGASYATSHPINKRPTEETAPHSLGSRILTFDHPQQWWERAIKTLGTAVLPPLPTTLQQLKGRAAAIAAERIFRVLIDAYQRHLAVRNYREYLQLLEQLALSQLASLNHRAATFTYRRLASQARTLSKKVPSLYKFHAGALIQFANQRMVRKRRKFLLRFYERAIRLHENEFVGKGNADTKAQLSTAYLSKAIACRFLGRTDEAITLCDLALARNDFEVDGKNVTKLEIAACSFVTRAQCRAPSDPTRIQDLAKGIRLYQWLVNNGRAEYGERLAIAAFELARFSGYGEPHTLTNLRYLEVVFWGLITQGDRPDLIEHYARVLIRISRELSVASCYLESSDSAKRAIRWLEEAVIRQGRDDLRYELADALISGAEMLILTQQSTVVTAQQIRRALRIFACLESHGYKQLYLPSLAKAHGLLALVLANGPANSIEARTEIARARAVAEQCGLEGQEASQKRTLDLVYQLEAALHTRQEEY
jgi:serine/threonine protein kinase